MKIWKVSHGTGFISESENEDLFQRHCVCVHPGTPAKGRSYTSQGENFENVKAGEYFYLCYSNTRIRLFGKFIGKSHNSTLKGKEDWLEQEYELIFESIKEGGYYGEKSWWTPNDNSTFIQVSDNISFEKNIFQPFFGKHLCDIESGETMENRKDIEAEIVSETVCLYSKSLEAVLGLSLNSCDEFSLNLDCQLNIPKYQRIYCWGEEQVITLLRDIEDIQVSRYFMGNLILHKKDGKYDIVDGQQRLVTLSIILHCLDETIPNLLNCILYSGEAQRNVVKNVRIIYRYLKNEIKKEKIKNNIHKLSFGVLVIDQKHLDLAFTFFTNTNSRGKKLTDYDLLKPHHLRYISSDDEGQQHLLATQWDSMINNAKKLADNPGTRRDADYVHVIELYLFRLRKWSKKAEGLEYERFIHNEFKCSPIIDDIPPLGEKLDFYEPIQGGQHFFEYIDHFMQKYYEFTNYHVNSGKKNVYELLCQYFSAYSDKWYRYVMEALIFCYYLKFGMRFINEATLSIVRYISQIRFLKQKAYEVTIVRYASESEIVMLIEQATSPTFFLAMMEQKNGNLYIVENYKGIRATFLHNCRAISEELSKMSLSISYKNYSSRYECIKTE